jgi:hypothetical protein
MLTILRSISIQPGFESRLTDIEFVERTDLPILTEQQTMNIGDETYIIAKAGEYPQDLSLIFEDTVLSLDQLLEAEEYTTVTTLEGDPIAFIDMTLEMLQSLINLKFQCVAKHLCADIAIEDTNTGDMMPATAYEFVILND